MTKKTYKVPTLRTINIASTEILAGSLNGDINTGSSTLPDGYEIIPGYDEDQGGWGTGSPD